MADFESRQAASALCPHTLRWVAQLARTLPRADPGHIGPPAYEAGARDALRHLSDALYARIEQDQRRASTPPLFQWLGVETAEEARR